MDQKMMERVFFSTLPTVADMEWERDAICALPPLKPNALPCEALFFKWTFSGDSGRCQPFTYGGCDGTENLFDSEYQCQRKCDRPGIESASFCTSFNR